VGIRVPYAVHRLEALGGALPDRIVFLTQALSFVWPEQEPLSKAIVAVWVKG
jgi:hypothetical protein